MVNYYGEGTTLTFFNVLVIGYTYLLFALTICSSFLVAVVWTAFQFSVVQNNPSLKSNIYFKVALQPLTWMLNFLTSTGLFYMFYYQGMQARRA